MKTDAHFSKMSIQSWGPSGWNFLHAITFKYPDNPSDKDRIRTYNFFKGVGYVLPCPKCSVHFSHEMDKHQPESAIFDNMHNLSKWLVKVHNDVNQRNNKPIVSYETVKSEYSFQTPPPTLNESSGPYVVFTIFILFVLIASLCVLRCKLR